MTKERHPLTACRALTRIADLIGYDGCAQVAEKSEWTMRKYADPDTEREISLRDAIRLDLAYRRAGGHGAPLFEAYGARLEIEATGSDDLGSMLQAVRDAAREGGEAIDAALSGEDTNMALREVEEAIEAFARVKVRLMQRRRGGTAHN